MPGRSPNGKPRRTPIALVVIGALANPNVWAPVKRAITGSGIPSVSWPSANAISIAVVLFGVLLWFAARWPRWKTALFVYTVVLIALGASEAALRIIRPPAALIQDYGYPPGLLIPDEEVGRRYAPHFDGRFTYLMYRDIEIRTNAMGFRDDEPDPDARYRVIVLGDSITFGSGVAARDRYTDVLERALSDKNVDVQSWGVNGTETVHQFALYEKHGSALPHDVVVVGFCLNDLNPVSVEELFDKTRRKAKMTNGLADRLGERGWSLHYLFVVKLAGAGWDTLAARLGPADTRAQTHRREYEVFLENLWSNDETLEALAGRIAALQAAASRSGARLVFVIFPYRFQFESHDFSPQKRLESILGDLGIPFVDLTDPFADAMKDGHVYLPGDDCHPNAAGHRAAGQSLIPLVESAIEFR